LARGSGTFGRYYEIGKILDIDNRRAVLQTQTRIICAWNVSLETYPLVTPFLIRPTYHWNDDASIP